MTAAEFDCQAARAQARLFANEHFSESSIQTWCRNQGMPPEVMKAFYSGPLGKIGLPKELGGLDSSFGSQVAVIEELHRCAGTMLPFVSQLMSVRLMCHLSGNKHSSFVNEMFRTLGEVGFSEAISEPIAGSDVFAMRTSVTEQGGEIILNGTKTFVTNGQFEPFIMVAACEPDFDPSNRRLSFWLVPRDLPGIYTYPIETVGQNLTPQAMIKFDNVPLLPEYAIGERGCAAKALKDLFDIGRTLVCASSPGLAKAAVEDAVRYASTRKTFGKPIYEHAQIQEKLVDMEIVLRSMEGATYRAAREIDHGLPSAHLSAALAKRTVPRQATELASQAMQIFGDVGYTELSRVGRIWRDCRGNQLAQGTDEIMVRVAGKRILSSYLGNTPSESKTRTVGTTNNNERTE